MAEKEAIGARARREVEEEREKVTAEGALLVVEDDDRSTLWLVGKRLEKRGYRVEDATDGREALEAIRLHRPAEVILDRVMPGLGGDEVCAELRADAQASRMPVVLLSPKAVNREISQGLGLGADAYVTKPFDMDELDAVLRHLLSASPEGGKRGPNG